RTLDVHALRHSFCTFLSKGGVAPRIAQAAMRHSDIKLTMNTYTDETQLDVQAALSVLPALAIDEKFVPQFVPAGCKPRQTWAKTDKMGNICERAIDAAENHIAIGSDELVSTSV